MKNTLRIEYDFIYLNEYIDRERTNRMIASSIKKKITNAVMEQALYANCNRPKRQVDMVFSWHVKGKYDSDNIAFAKKFVLDGMVKAGVLENDNPKCVRHLKDYIYHDVKKPNLDYVEVSWEETNE